MKILIHTIILLLIALPAMSQSNQFLIQTYNDEIIKRCNELINYAHLKIDNTGTTQISKCASIETTHVINILTQMKNRIESNSLNRFIALNKAAILNKVISFITINDSICVHIYGVTNNYSHIYGLLYQWQELYDQLQTYVFPQENIYERQERQIKSLDSSLQCISEYVERLNQSKIISDNSHNNPLDSIIDRLDSIKLKMPFTHSPDYSTKFDSMNRYLFKIDSVSKSIDTLTKEMNDHIAKIKEELVDNKKHYLSIMAGFEYHRSVSKKSNVFIGLGGIEFRKDSSAIAGRVGVTTQGLPIVSVSYQFSPVCYAVVQTIGIYSTTLPNSRTLLSGHIGYKLPNIIQLELGVYGYLIGEQNFSIGIGAKTALTSIKF